MYRVFPGVASAVSTPPTPFADRQSLEAELKALEQDLDGDISKLLHSGLSNMSLGVAWNPSMVLTSQAARHSTDYSLSTDGGEFNQTILFLRKNIILNLLLHFQIHNFISPIVDNLSDGSSVNSYQLPGLSSYNPYSTNPVGANGNSGYHSEEQHNKDTVDQFGGLAAVYQMRDIDSFIANLTVPPPPTNSSAASSTDDILLKASKKVLSGKQGKNGVLSQEDISGNQSIIFFLT